MLFTFPHTSKHAGSDPEAFWLRLALAITASVQQPESARIAYASSDFPHLFQFLFFFFFFQRRRVSCCAKPTWIRSGWPGQCLAKCIWSGNKPVCRNLRGALPVSHFQTRFPSSTDVTDNIVQNQPGSDLVLADCVRFWPNGSGPEASQCARIIRPASGQGFPADPDRMRTGSGMFTGLTVWTFGTLTEESDYRWIGLALNPVLTVLE